VNAALHLLRPTAFLRHLGAQMAFVALLAAALMPTLARLALPDGLADRAAICQSAPAGSPQDSPASHDDLCAFCTLAQFAPALPAAAPAALAVVPFAPPAPLAPAAVRASVAQSSPPDARGPPPVA